jgi:hypothetical protein
MACSAPLPGNYMMAADFAKTFHVSGIPDAKRGTRTDISLAPDALLFELRRTRYEVPYVRIKQVLLLRSERHYEKTTLAAAMGTGALGVPIGTLVIMAKHKVDTIVLDYENERKGRMGVVMQLERGQGQELCRRLIGLGVTVVEPPPERAKGRRATKSETTSKFLR